MTTRVKVFLSIGGLFVLAGIFGAAFGSAGRNDEFQPTEEFKLEPWFSVGPVDFDRAVFYLLIGCLLTTVAMVYIARRMEAKPNRIQTAVEQLYALMRDNIAGGNMDHGMAKRWFPFVGALFLFIWFSNLIGYIPLPTNTHEK